MPSPKTIDAYIDACPAAVVPLIRELRAFIAKTLPGSTEGMKYGAPYFFNAKGAAVIYLYGARDHVNFGFLKSAELSDPDDILKGSGDPSKHVKIYPDQPIDWDMLRAFTKQCETITP
ncbi:MAG: DUF1801 domain-containing protein [Rhizobiales bacterium]|nr:DUF1801 domain-containing protein [Hyphomicrobiales bacterium]MBO6700147.1 DUF1801 domain-containing protein [Hyphomicrobiales bacterium]MBO6737688.1 DUF1801 domain-containing protein [Hyphomicrobiales bacterium]MBO6913255.1 DUF1801 domain-containing protein [Hyphomicrobiales bacterium]MBO6954299.1 DUF1801 domain-containing protein [Hyphomicrobiales bacterium]